MATASTNLSLGRRYLFKLVSNTATIPLFFILEAVLPRALGPAAYGNYNFSTNLFQNFTNFLDMGTSACLFTSLSKRPGEFGLIAVYARFAAIMLILCLLAGLLVLVPDVGRRLMPDVPLWMALPAAIWAYITWMGRVTRGMNDALGLTTHSELIRLGINLFSAMFLLVLYYSGSLNLAVLFGHQYLTLGLLAAGFALCLRGNRMEHPFAASSKNTAKRTNAWSLSKRQYTDYAREFRRYSGPLFVTALCSAFALSGERWILQFFNGSAEQGYFSLSQKIGMACFIFVSAMTPLLTRDLAVAHAKGSPGEMARLLDRFAPMLYALSACLACFTLAEAKSVVRLFGGGQFVEALLPVQIMALYPIHQSYGQIAGAVFYATGETRLLRNITLLMLFAGLSCAWILLAPPDFSSIGDSSLASSSAANGGIWSECLLNARLPGGFALGAAGLAWKMVGMQCLTVNILLIACRRSVPFRYRRNLVHQAICPAALILLAYIARHATETVWPGDHLARLLLSGCCYGLLCLLLAFAVPFVFGLERKDITHGYIRKFLKF
ncbi:MAG: oligosaccharide flippase family protein [Desulfovibrio sp.]|jgi:O-antigen/teichoic acid export membrane protein|nr:oligosaccharide flippase family protein [Desulfovibrio sp.]